MKYKHKPIGDKPTYELLHSIISRKQRYQFTTRECWDFWEARNWCRKDGSPFKSLESAIEVYKSIWESAHNVSPNAPKINPKLNYAEQLQTKQWKAFREFVFSARGKRCEMCGDTMNLQIHHPKYKNGRKAWEYTCNEVRVLCNNCHKIVHNKQ